VGARTLLAEENFRSYIRVVNLSEIKFTITEGAFMGSAEPVEVCDDVTSGESDSSSDDRTGVGGRLRSMNTAGSQRELPHIQPVIDALPSELTDDQRNAAIDFIIRHADIFSKSEFDLGRTSVVKHTIDTGNNRPFRQQLRRHPIAHLKIIDDHVEKMLRHGIIKPAENSEWASNVVLARRSNGDVRFCVDFRQLNSLTHKDSYPLPRIDTCMDALGGCRWFSSLDMKSGYWQVEEADSEKTSFLTRKGLWSFNVMAFGLTGAPACFQRLVNVVLSGLTWEVCLAFLDDVIVMAETFEQELLRLELVFERFKRANLRLNGVKCKLFQRKVKFLGSIISAEGRAPDPSKVAAVVNWPTPRNLRQTRGFVALAGYYRKHIAHFAEIARPLHELTRKGRRFEWGPRQQRSFEILKQKLTTAPLLAAPIDGGRYVLDTDASDEALGAVLQQYQDGVLRVIAYASRALLAPERVYCVTRRELLAVVYGLKEFRHYLLGAEFDLRTDNSALSYMLRSPVLVSQQARYLDLLAEFNYVIHHRPGRLGNNSDSLSRRPCEQDPDADPCEQCRRAQPELTEHQCSYIEGHKVQQSVQYYWRASITDHEREWVEDELNSLPGDSAANVRQTADMLRVETLRSEQSEEIIECDNNIRPENRSSEGDENGMNLHSQSAPANCSGTAGSEYSETGNNNGVVIVESSNCEAMNEASNRLEKTEVRATTVSSIRQTSPPVDNNIAENQRQAVNECQPSSDLAAAAATAARPTAVLTMYSISPEVIRQEQRNDPVVGTLIRWLENADSQPSLNEIVTLDPEIQKLYAQRATLELRNDVLYRQFYGADSKIRFYQLIVPRSLRIAWMEGVHNNGHQAAKITGERLRQYAYWEGWKKDVEIYCRRCEICCKYRRGPRFKQGEMQLAHGCTVMQKVHIDLTGKHVRSRNGFCYLLTAICSFTKYLIAVPLRSKESLGVARALVKHIYLVYGAVEIQISDNGGEFWNSVVEGVAKLMGVHTSRITSLRPNSNGVVERVHKSIASIYAKLISANQRNWDELTPYVTYYYNTAYHSATTYSPFYLMFLREPTLNIDLIAEVPRPEGPTNEDEFVLEARERMRIAYTIVREHLKSSFGRAKTRYDHRVKAIQFHEGQLVWWYIPRGKKGLGRKWLLMSTGPYKIIKKLNDVNVIIQKSPRAKTLITHIDRLKPYEGAEPDCWRAPTSPAESPASPGAAPASPGFSGSHVTGTSSEKPAKPAKPANTADWSEVQPQRGDAGETTALSRRPSRTIKLPRRYQD